jgi:hypothetical protein
MGRDPHLEAYFRFWQDKTAVGEMTEQDWIEAGKLGFAFFERYWLAANADLKSDLTAADRSPQ